MFIRNTRRETIALINFVFVFYFPEQIEKRRAEVNKEMADIVKQFDADIEALKEPNDNTNINTNPTDRSSDKRDSSHTNATNEKNKDNSFDGNDESKNRRNSHHQRNNDNDHSADDDDDDDDDDDKSDSDEDERRNTMMSGGEPCHKIMLFSFFHRRIHVYKRL